MREDWEYKTFGEIGTFLRGKNIQKADFVSGGLPCIHYGQIHTKFDISIDYHLSEIPQEVYDKAIIASPGDVIIAITSEDIDGSCKSVVWLGNYDIAVSAHAAILKHNMNGKFIAYYLRSNTFFTQKLKYARGFKVMEIKTKDLAKLVLPIPPKPTQLFIVSELDKINKLIQIKKEQLKDYDALAQSIFYEMFGDPVVNEKGWEVKKFGDLFKLKSGDGLSSKDFNTGIYPVYGGNGISGYHNSFNMKGCYIIIGRVGVYCGNVRKVDGEFWLTDNAFRLIYKENEQNSFFILYLLNILDLHQYANAAAQPVISNLTLKSINVPLPPLSLQQSFAHKIEQIDRQKAEVQKTITDLETLLAARMQYWFD